MKDNEFKALPLASFDLTSKILELANQGLKYKQIKKGINETIKGINKGVVTCVILASDAEPLVLIAPIVKLCEEHSIPYCFIQDQACLG